MSQIKFLAIAFTLCLLPKPGISQHLVSEIDKLFQVNENEPGFSIAVFKGNDIILEKTYGVENLDYGNPITTETVFDIGSISKQFTAAAILLLEKEGKLSLDEPISTYLPQIPNYEKGMPTVRHLLNQTSGIKEIDPYWGVIDLHAYDYKSESQMVNIITKIDALKFKPGEYFYYTNSNYILLAAIIREVSGQSLGAYAENEIFEPLGMQHTVIKDDIYRIVPSRAIGYQQDEEKWYKTHTSAFVLAGDGQVLTTPRDMFKWHLNLQHSKIGTADIWALMQTKSKLNNGKEIDYGLGTEFETYRGYKAYGHEGMWMGGFVSKYLYFPELDIAFFTTQNKFEWDFRDRFFQLVDLYIESNKASNLAPKRQAYKPIKLSKKELIQYEGEYLFYNNVNHQERAIKFSKGKLYYQTLEDEKIGELIYIGNHQFVYLEDGDDESRIQFHFNADKKQFSFDNRDGELPKIFKEFVPYEHSNKELLEFVGTYYNKDFQIGKEIRLEEGALMYYYRNGAWKTEIASISKDLLNTPPAEIQFIRNNKEEITSFVMMGLAFEKIQL